jgi:NADH-quinone oxidoreductase subunit C
MDKAIQEQIAGIIRERFESDILSVETPYDFLTINFRKEKIIDLIRYLYDHPVGKFQYLTTLCGIHYPDQKQIGVMYQLHSLVNNWRVRIRIFLPEENPVTPTLTTVYSAANWMERETYDFFGVQFTGHPDLRRILNVEEMIMFPMRKEFPLEDQTREDKEDFKFGR